MPDSQYWFSGPAIFIAVSFAVTVGQPMSALGQKQTFAPQKAMSALPPTATAKADIPQW